MEAVKLHTPGSKTKHAKFLFKCPTCGMLVVSGLYDGKAAKQCKKCYHATFGGEGNPNHRHGGRTVHKNLWNVWAGMKQRCLNPKNPKYPRYGGRGITVCAAWMEFNGFMSWAQNNGWENGLSLDRIDLNGNYCPENCQFLTVSENSRWKSTTKNLAAKPRLSSALSMSA